MTVSKMKLRTILGALTTAVVLTGCGGGGSGGNPPTNPVTPDEIAFTALDNVAPRLDYGSELLTIKGISAGKTLAIGVSGEHCRLVVNDTVVGESAKLKNNDTLRVIARAPLEPGAAAECTVDAGKDPVSFIVTTGPNNGTFHVTPGAVHTSWNAYNASALSSYEIRGRLAGRPESGVMLVDKFSPEITSHTFEVNSLDVDWGNDFLSVWACSNLVGTGISNGYSPCQALMDIDRKLEQALSVDAIGYFKPEEGASFRNGIALNATGDVLAVLAAPEGFTMSGLTLQSVEDCYVIESESDERECEPEARSAIHVFRKINGQWRQEAVIEAETGDVFQTVALNAAGDVLAVGAPTHEYDYVPGVVFLYRHRDNDWHLGNEIRVSDGVWDSFGQAVALNATGNRLVASAPYKRRFTGARPGMVYLFELDDSGVVLNEHIVDYDPKQGEWFGDSVALNAAGDVLAASVIAGDDSGSVHVFQEAGGSWQAAEPLVSPVEPRAGDLFGYAVSLDDEGSRLAVGMPIADEVYEGPEETGAVYVYTRAGDSWSPDPVAHVKPSIGYRYMRFGHAVVLSGDGKRLAVSSVYESSPATGINGDPSAQGCIEEEEAEEDCPSAGSGAVYLFADTPGGWQQTHYLKALHSIREGNFGASLAINATGTKVAVFGADHSAATGINGNPVDDCDSDEPVNCSEWSGAVYLFE